MSSELLQKLEDKIDNALETIELLRLQNEELEEKYSKLLNENSLLKNKHAAWEQNLTNMLEKLDAIEPKSPVNSRQTTEQEEVMPA
ncbi:MAG TPA: cell division protein ZapB [Gammaproteobacteria bacterium]|nr:cell division protein ZapB [Gammaproteobacteria bacterium]